MTATGMFFPSQAPQANHPKRVVVAEPEKIVLFRPIVRNLVFLCCLVSFSIGLGLSSQNRNLVMYYAQLRVIMYFTL